VWEAKITTVSRELLYRLSGRRCGRASEGALATSPVDSDLEVTHNKTILHTTYVTRLRLYPGFPHHLMLRVNNMLVHLAAMFILTLALQRQVKLVAREGRRRGSWLLAEVMTVSISFLHNGVCYLLCSKYSKTLTFLSC
jgi:hypothetical protein